MKPLILSYAVERTDRTSVPYEYKHHYSMSFLEIKGEILPLIESNQQNIELLTKTKVYQERDDEDVYMLELETKTLVKTERDDENFNHN